MNLLSGLTPSDAVLQTDGTYLCEGYAPTHKLDTMIYDLPPKMASANVKYYISVRVKAKSESFSAETLHPWIRYYNPKHNYNWALLDFTQTIDSNNWRQLAGFIVIPAEMTVDSFGIATWAGSKDYYVSVASLSVNTPVVIASASTTLSWSASILTTTRYYQLAAPTVATPLPPTSTSLGSWTETEPTADMSKVLYTCEETVYTDGSVAYSKPSKSTSYEAAKEAKSIASNAQGMATELTRTRAVHAACSTAANVAGKIARLGEGAIVLKDGASVMVTFTHANTAPAPTLNVGETGPKPIITNGAPSAYWADGASVMFTYDGTAWQVCSTPVYGSTATIGDPAGGNVYVDANGVQIRKDQTSLASFSGSKLQIGPDNSAHVSLDTDSFDITDGTGQQSLSLKKNSISFGATSDSNMAVNFGQASIMASKIKDTYDMTLASLPTKGAQYADISSASITLQPIGNIERGISVTVDGKKSVINMDADYFEIHGTLYPISMIVSCFPVLLYDNPGNNENGIITLSETSAHFQRMTIYFRSDTNNYSSVDVWDPNGKLAVLSMNVPWPTIMCMKGRCILIYDDKISTSTNDDESFRFTGQAYIDKAGSTRKAFYEAPLDTLFITKVLGYRKVYT